MVHPPPWSLHYFDDCWCGDTQQWCKEAAVGFLRLFRWTTSVCCSHPASVWSAVPVTTSQSLLLTFTHLNVHTHFFRTTHQLSTEVTLSWMLFWTVAKDTFLQIVVCMSMPVDRNSNPVVGWSMWGNYDFAYTAAGNSVLLCAEVAPKSWAMVTLGFFPQFT